MSCCGQKREAAVYEQRPQARVDYQQASFAAHRAAPAQAAGPTVTLKSRSGSPLAVVGPSGKRYQFQGKGSMQGVDRSDAESLVASGLFERVWG
jgi:hypothetical protein